MCVCVCVCDLIGDNLDVEVALISFVTVLKSAEIRGAPYVFILNLQEKMFELLEENDAVSKSFL